MKLYIVLVLALAAQSYASNYQGSSDESESRIHRNHNDQQYLQQLLQSASVESRSARWQSSASALPEASSYKTKVEQRINNSHALSEKHQTKQTLYKMADEKLEKCVKNNGQDLDKHCVGRTTGQVMQLIAAIENENRPTIHGVGHRRQHNDY